MVTYLCIELKHKLLLGLESVASGLRGSLYKLLYKSNGAVIILQSLEREAIKDCNLGLVKLLLGENSAEESVKRTNLLSIVQSESTLTI